MSIQDQIANRQRQLDDIASEIELLNKLPAGLNLKTLTRVHKRWQVYLPCDVASGLALLPPCNARMTYFAGNWVGEPEQRPLDWEQRTLAVWRERSTVSWNHWLDADTVVSVHCDGVLPVPQGYTLAPAFHQTVLQRTSKPTELKLSPTAQATAAWDAFFAAQGYNAQQRAFGNAVMTLANRNVELTVEMLPRPQRTTMEVAGQELQILTSGASGEPAEELPLGSPLHGFKRIGRFWASFTPEQAQALLDFAARNRCDLEGRCNTAANKGLAQVEAALVEFEQQHLQAVANQFDASVVELWVRQRTGLPVNLHRCNLPRSPNDPLTRVRFSLWRWHRDACLKVPRAFDPAGLDFQNPPFLKFEANNHSF